jgi:uncharacterized secreted protein with C-terminal beta-propeller domain
MILPGPDVYLMTLLRRTVPQTAQHVLQEVVVAAFGKLDRVVRRISLAAGGVACAAALAVLGITATTNGTSGGGDSGGTSGTGGTTPQPAIRPAAMLLSNYSSCPELLAGLRSHAVAASVGPYGLPSLPPRYGNLDELGKGVQAAATPVPAASAASTDTSTTNVQEAGVDEPDLVKTDHGRLITITDGTLRVIDDGSRKVTGALDLRKYRGWQGAQLLVDGDNALVILPAYYSQIVGGPAPMIGIGARQYEPGRPPRSSLLFVDLNGRPRVTGSLQASGSYLDARMVGSTVRLVVASTPTIGWPPLRGNFAADNAKAANEAAIRTAPLTAWLPQYTITSGTLTTSNTVPCGQVSHPAKYTGASLLTIYTLDLTQLTANPRPITIAADGDTVYATSASLYVASNPSWYCCPTPAEAQRTEIHRFDITGSAQPKYLGSASIPGRLLSQYSLSDYAGYLRIATTGGAGPSPQSSSVYVLDAQTLKITGRVTGLGKGEQLYAVRFIGPLAYVVTFRQTDPLYVLDLRNPAAPKVAGTLQLTGYSDYLHDAGNGRLIGVGQQASPTGRVAGLQVSLFDVSNPAAPNRTGQVVRADAPGEGALDPHAFLYWQPTGLIVTPVQSWAPDQTGKVLVLKVSGTTLTSGGMLANPRPAGTADDGLGIQRSVLVNGMLWTVSGGGVQVIDPSTLSRQTWIPFG